jgi:hypothetical protein
MLQDDWVLCKIYEHQYGMKKSQMEGQNNKQVTITVAPQCQQLNQYHQTQCMQSSLSPNMVDNSQFQFNQYSQVQKMQDDSSKYVAVSCQPNQCSESQPNEVSSSSNMIGITQCQPNQHDDAQQMQVSSSSNMNAAPQYHSNQYPQAQPNQGCFLADYNSQYLSNQHFQDQQTNVFLSTNEVYDSQYLRNQHSQDQQMQDSQMEDDYILQLINLDDKDSYVNYFEEA